MSITFYDSEIKLTRFNVIEGASLGVSQKARLHEGNGERRVDVDRHGSIRVQI
jgi:hypothetical protein